MVRSIFAAALLAALLLPASEARAQDCAAGSYSGTGSEPCTPCGAGTYQPGTGATSCLGCDAGTYADMLGSTSCSSCSAGTYSNTGSASCTFCDPGTFSSGSAGSCTPCNAGQTSPMGSSSCTNCNAGEYAPAPGSPSCQTCDAGTASASGSASCTPCNAGTFAPPGAETCSNCSIGKYSGPGAAGCTDCPAGTASATIGAPSCTNCGAGTYELSTGSAVCDPCPGGTATPCNNNGTCSDGPTGDGTCACNSGYSGIACEIGPPTTTTTTTTLESLCAPAPLSGCVIAGKAGFQVSLSTTSSKNKLKWKLGAGDASVAQAQLGDPSADTTWVLCIYDRVANVPTAVGVLEVQPNASWTSKDPKGWKYKDTTLAQAGVSGMSLKTGDAGKTKAQLKAGGANFPAPVAASMSQMFTSNPNVTVQLVKEGGAGGALCYTSDFAPDDTKKNTATSFKATAK